MAFAANAFSPRGLKLTRNYFPGDSAPRHTHVVSTNQPQALGSTNVPAADPTAMRLQAQGLQVATSEQTSALFNDPRYQQGLVVFIDARDDQHYQQGHIPGAHQLNHYFPERYLGAIIPACQAAQQIVVYCKGGECEDSEHAAIMLHQSLGVPKEKMFIYLAGITEWQAKGYPVELGTRNSWQVKTTNK